MDVSGDPTYNQLIFDGELVSNPNVVSFVHAKSGKLNLQVKGGSLYKVCRTMDVATLATRISQERVSREPGAKVAVVAA